MAVEAESRLTGESLSAHLRRAAVIRLLVEESEKRKLEVLADRAAGLVKKENHPEWGTKKQVRSWVRKLREDWQ